MEMNGTNIQVAAPGVVIDHRRMRAERFASQVMVVLRHVEDMNNRGEVYRTLADAAYAEDAEIVARC